MPQDYVTLEGSVPPTDRHQRIGPPDPNEHIEVTVKLKRKTEDGLPTLAEFMEGKRSAGITRQDLNDKYGASQDAADAVQRWAVTQGLAVARVDLGRRMVRLSGTAAAMGAAFGVTMSVYRHARSGKAFRCPETDVRLPASLADAVTGVFGLNNMPILTRHSVRVGRQTTEFDPKAAWPGSFYPQEVAKLYNFPPTTGAGQKVAILEFGGGIDRSVLNDYFTKTIGLATSPTINAISVMNTPIVVDDDVTGEVYLDLEVVGVMAPKAVIDVYFAPWSGNGYLNAIEKAIRNDDYAAISISYGLDEDLAGDTQNPGWPALNKHVDEAFRDAVALGLPLFVSSGDQGSSSLRGSVGHQEVTVSGPNAAAGYPGSSPYATCVGGTALYAKNGGIDREIVWNELGPLQTVQQGAFYFGGATGGGVSDRYAAPSYQTKAGLNPKSANTGGRAGRGVPDVAGNSGSFTGYLVSQTPHSKVAIAPVGGTSAAAPMWAALMACVRESLTTALNGKIPVFFFNDFVYACGKTAAFRDIVGGRQYTLDPHGRLTPGAFIAVGDNKSASANGYKASPGYDLCTGWGSPNGVELLNQLKGWLATQKPAVAGKLEPAG